jgi:ABC-type Zn uptake system ZnuABC Zn-binding protein ZnuA
MVLPSRALLPNIPLIFLILAGLLSAVQPVAGEKPLIVATTSVLGSVVEDLAGDQVEVIILVSPAICPSHYDVKPSDVYAISRARLIFYHGMEGWLNQLYESSGSKAELVKISGGWSTPEGARKYYEEVASALRSKLGIDVSARLEQRLRELDDVARQIMDKVSSQQASSIKVIAMEWQRDFVEWLGFKVVDTFSPPEKVSSADVERLVRAGVENGASLVVSNLQSGVELGETVAREIGAIHVILSNFPGSDPETKTLIDLIRRNAGSILGSLDMLAVKRELSRAVGEAELYRALSYILATIVAAESIILAYLVVRRWRKT